MLVDDVPLDVGLDVRMHDSDGNGNGNIQPRGPRSIFFAFRECLLEVVITS